MIRRSAPLRRVRCGALVCAPLLAAATLIPAPAEAHGVSSRADLPLPTWLFGWAAAAVLIASFVALATLWREPRLADRGERRLVGVPAPVEVLCGLLGVVVFAVLVYSGLEGEQSPASNILPTFVFVAFWVGVPVLSVLFGDVFSLFNPWRAIARTVSWVAGRTAGDALADPLPYPARIGFLPAAFGILAFGWVELVWTRSDEPALLAVLALFYAAVQLVGMCLFGVRSWTARADAFAVYFAMFGRLSPFAWHDGWVAVRRPLSGLSEVSGVRGLVALLCVAIGITMFDGGSEGPLWLDLAPTIQGWFMAVGLSAASAISLAFTIGLLACVAVVAAIYGAGVWGMRSAAGTPLAGLALRFASSLVPITFAYILAHYVSLLVFQGQALGYLASNPLGRSLAPGDGGLFGTAGWAIDYTILSATTIWYVQVAALVTGHVAGLVVAHDQALSTFPTARLATRSQYWMLTVMVAFTSLGLWLLSAANS